jgi:serine/threonine-protein kinase PpkA
MTPAHPTAAHPHPESRHPRRAPLAARRAVAAGGFPRLDGYRLQRKLGEGRLATVYLALDRAGAQVALKVMRREHAGSAVRTAAFAREFAVPWTIRNPHIVRVFEQVRGGDGDAAIAMEFLGGGHLGDRIGNQPSAGAAISLLRQAAVALAALHRHGVAHGDVKPANLLLRSNGDLVLADFGLARGPHPWAQPALAGLVVGTPRYAAPEQSQCGMVGAAADVYSLGVVCHELLCGKPPFPGDTVLEVLSQHLMAPVPRLPAALARFQPLLDAMLAKQAGGRLPHGEAVVQQIDLLQGAAPLHRAPSGAFASRCQT